MLTAAHCIPEAGEPRQLDLVRLGGHDLSQAEEVGAVDYGVERVFIHPLFSPAAPHLHDIAIIVLDTPGESLQHCRDGALELRERDVADASSLMP